MTKTDTEPADSERKSERVFIEMIRRAPVWKRAEQLAGLIHGQHILILADLRRRYPHADPDELRKRLAARLLPRDIVMRLYGWDPEKEGY